MAFRDWILDRFTPAVMVVSSPEADAMCQERNGLTVVDLLRPFGFFPHLSVPVRTVGEQPYRIREFRLRFFDAPTLHPPPLEVAEEHLKSVLTSMAAETGAEDFVDLLSAMRKGELPRQSPWFEKFRHEFLRMVAFSDLETFDHPVACLLVLHSHADDPHKAFEQLYRTADLPPMMKMGIMESKLLNHYLLLHDNQLEFPGGLAWAEEKLQALSERLGSTACHLVQLNSGSGTLQQTGAYEGLFRAQMQMVVPGGGAGEPAAHPKAPMQGLGACLADSDLRGLSIFLEDFTVCALLPHLETRVRTLHQQVLATRKGVRNQLKNLLWRSKSSASDLPRAVAAPGPAFGSQSLDGQLRTLADLAFLMHDNETCLSTLRMLSSDLKSSKDWRHYAAVQEMLGLAAFMAGSPMTEVTGHFREAFIRYDAIAGRSNKEMRRYATRSQLLLAEYCCQHSLFGEANAALMRAQNQEENLIAAVLLEQAALYLLHIAPPGVRKWAFHLVLAALRFSNCQQPRLANRAYRQVMGVFDGRQWGHIDGHLQDMLGRHAAETGEFPAAARHFAATLACADSHPNRQRQLLAQFLDTVKRLTSEQMEQLAALLPLPEIDAEHIDILYDDAFTFANAEARSYSESFWKGLAAPMLAGKDTVAGPTWLDGGSKNNLPALQRRTAVMGEEIGLDVDLHNPLALQLRLSRLRAAVEATTSGNHTVEEEEVVLRGGERMRVRLKIRGLQAGLLKVVGLKWQLEGLAMGYKALQMRQLPQPRSRGQEKEAEPSVTFDINMAMPRLQVKVTGLDRTVYEGEIVRCVARLDNTGILPLSCLRLLVASPELLCCPSEAHLHTSLTSRQDFSASEGGTVMLSDTGTLIPGGGRMYAWQPDFSIAPGETLQWPFFLHPQRAGSLALQCVWQYEASPANINMPWRMLRWSHTIDVLPLMQLQPTILPSSVHLHCCLLRILVSGSEGGQTVELQETACSSPGWQISPVGDPHSDGATLPSLATSIHHDLTLLAGAQAAAVCQLYPPMPQKEARTPGNTWLTNGPIAHFHAERRRQHHLALSSAQGNGDRFPRRSSAQSGAAQTPTASSAAANIAIGGPATPAEESNGVDIAVAWRIPGTLGRPDRLGVHHLLCCRLRDNAMMRAIVLGERHHHWDFAQGPLEIRLLLRVCNHQRITASLCVEAGTSLDFLGHDACGSEARRWQMRLQTEPAPQGGSVPGTPGRARSSTGGAAAASSAQTSPASTPRQTGMLPLAASVEEASGLPSPAPYLWTGQTRASIPHLEPGSTAEVPLQVLLFGPGNFQLSDYSLFWTFPNGSMNSAQLGPPILLVVEQT